MIKVLTLLNDMFNEMNIPYTFDNWDTDIELPQFIGEISETPTADEDGCNEYAFILTGYATNYSYLFGVAEQLKSKFKTSDIVENVVITYVSTNKINNGTDDLKQVQITLKIKDWSV